jgi:hypothetical protein
MLFYSSMVMMCLGKCCIVLINAALKTELQEPKPFILK